MEILGDKFSFVLLDRYGVLQLNIMNIRRYKSQFISAIDDIEQNTGMYTLSDGIYKETAPISIGFDISPLDIKAAVKQARNISVERRPQVVYLWFQKNVWFSIFKRYTGTTTLLSRINEKDINFIFGKQLKTFERKPFFKYGKLLAVHPPDNDKEEQHRDIKSRCCVILINMSVR